LIDKELIKANVRILNIICILMASTTFYLKGDELLFWSLQYLNPELFSDLGTVVVG